jgi:phenylalanyl-tRNA synthetase alpha chain
MSSAHDAILASLDKLRAEYGVRFATAATEQALRDENAKVLGKKGELTAILKQMGQVAADERRAIGEKVNALKDEIERAFEGALGALARKKREAELAGPRHDLTLPGRPLPVGHAHPISIVRDEIVDIFRSMGFAVHDGPEVDEESNNFGRLGYPPDHPATDMQDTFWVRCDGVDGAKLLRSHTSNIQVRAMMSVKPPMAFIAPGAVYRRDDDVTHSPMFHQLEAFLVDEKVSLAHLKGVLQEFAVRLYGPGTPVRLRPSYFPFVEPGAEVDIGCTLCKGKGCNVCKQTGWLEILGCGMIHPVVFESCGIDPEKWTGFALGMGLERVAMLRYGIPDIRLLFESDPRFLAQFPAR